MNASGDRVDNDIVIVDDDALTRELIQRALRSTDCDIRYFADGESALSYLENHTTRILIVDHRMPRLDGLELLQRLFDGSGINAARTYLCSAADLPEYIREKATALGARLLSKDVFRNKTRFRQLVGEI